ncbi:hypothetical protein IWQ61_002050 [Dispira simplex]|nr:hypothetical protein IWQ61_002050 [Dispira simplex]
MALPKPTTSLNALQNINLRRLDQAPNATAPPSPSTITSDSLWQNKPALLFIVRRPGCVFCREEALSLAQHRTTIENQWGLQMVAIVHEELGALEFQQEFWKGPLYLDADKSMFKALGQGQLRWCSSLNIANPTVFLHGARASQKGVKGNFKGEGRILGGLYVVKAGEGGVVYEYKEKIFGDHAPIEQVLEACQTATGQL